MGLNEGGWFLQMGQRRKNEYLSGVSSPSNCLVGFYMWGRPLWNLVWGPGQWLGLYRSWAHQAPPLLLPSSFFPNHLLLLFLWGLRRGKALPEDGVPVHLASAPQCPSAIKPSSPWPRLYTEKFFGAFLLNRATRESSVQKGKLFLYPFTHH